MPLLTDAVADRLSGAVPSLTNRVKGVLDLGELVRQKALPQYTPAAFVIENGLSGRAADSSENAFLQLAEETVSIVLVLRTAADVDGARTQPKLGTLKWQVLFALCGWSPADDADTDTDGSLPIGVFELRRGRLVSFEAGTVFYQLDLAIVQQIRVIA